MHLRQSLFDRSFAVAVYGAGYAGLAAALACADAGLDALLIDRRPAIAWESGWAFALDAGQGVEPGWREWLARLEARGGYRSGTIDGAIAEIEATRLARERLSVLLHAAPLAAELAADGLGALVVGTKSGLRRVRAARWIDASEDGELVRLLDPQARPRSPIASLSNLFLRSTRWSGGERAVRAPELAGEATLRTTAWDDQRCLSLRLPGAPSRHRSAWVPALRAVRAESDTTDVLVTHASVAPLPIYAAGGAPTARVPANVALASPAFVAGAVTTLSERWCLGAAAARALPAAASIARLADAEAVALPRLLEGLVAAQVERCDVAVAGLGTGGAVAAIAAARAGARVLALEPLPFAGGIGAGGGIHWYYFGMKGGLQEEVDARMRELAPLFGRPAQVFGYHPEVKKLALEQLLDEAGVDCRFGAMLVAAERDGRRIARCLAAAGGPLRVSASAWIDASGDGDLAAAAGAEFRLGRVGDGQLHAYTQSSGLAEIRDDAPRLQVVNYDSGFVDPTDPEDLTRARLAGFRHYERARWEAGDRPTYLAPALGVRQARHLVTDVIVELADLIERRRFADAIGRTGSHYDNHAVDLEFESDEGLFWTWACRQWLTRTACDIPYGALLPRGLDDLWIACRALGVSADAHHSLRMQRDMQRIGEASGIAAALAARHGCGSREVPMSELRAALRASGALATEQVQGDPYGPAMVERAGEGDVASGIADLGAEDDARAGAAMWRLYRARAADSVAALLDDARPSVSWRAAAVLALLGDARAEARLCQAVAGREIGPALGAREQDRCDLLPRWLVSISLLRCCGGAAAVATLRALGAEPLPFNACTGIAVACRRIAERVPSARAGIAELLELLELLAAQRPPALAPLRRKLLEPPPEQPPADAVRAAAVREDLSWQLALAIARARLAVGLPVQPEAEDYRTDARSRVRAAFAALGARVVAASAS